MSSRPLVSIIIVTWNGRALLETCLPSVLGTTYPVTETIVVDNGSADGTVPWLETHYPAVRVVALESNKGFCGGNNAGIAAARGEYVVLLNNDVEVTLGWLEPLVDWMESHPECAAAQPKLLRYDVRHQFEYAGAAGGFLDAYGYPFTRGRLFGVQEIDEGQHDTPMRVFWATGAALFLRRRALTDAEVLDERFFMHMEEIDLCWRLQLAGYEIHAIPASVVYHIGGASLPQGEARKTYYNFRNNLLLLFKNLTPGEWRRLFPRRALLDLLAAARFLATGSSAEAAAVLRAYRDAHRMKHRFAADRPATPSAIFPPYSGAIVLDHFLHGVQRFAQLPLRYFRRGYGPRPPLLEPDGEPDSDQDDHHADHAK